MRGGGYLRVVVVVEPRAERKAEGGDELHEGHLVRGRGRARVSARVRVRVGARVGFRVRVRGRVGVGLDSMKATLPSPS